MQKEATRPFLIWNSGTAIGWGIWDAYSKYERIDK
jgi:hypothetical protein